ncbi:MULTISPECIES: TetR family transcriptional regulator [unclassified Amycolatopsis]|uniref:TetR family transcriptional regulator n=1 Tax=unclassified Amycolatopsis TaxID=2618356 RepID=UPI002876D6E8|nr:MULTISPECIES: TetR family transcriptional regulator [unclassified Amycolatopsis]MDS0139267.1 TetR family transcriptional regulator [Amycolatopsis sp. 505]MDS0144499.1 TetR family transcriptional regulator [Amycolatopsis sp. CM201R]
MTTTGTGRPAVEGLRERKKRMMRRQLSDTAARMFLERGFDAVRVADVGAACGVSEKTVFNYFPSKEALLLDRLEATADALRTHLPDPALTLVSAMLTILDDERDSLAEGLAADPDQDRALARYRKFGDLIRNTPSLRAYQSDIADRFVDIAAEALATRTGLRPDDPEPQLAAATLLGLWRVQFRALRTHVRPGHPLPAAIDAVSREVRRAAHLAEAGLATFPAPAKPS